MVMIPGRNAVQECSLTFGSSDSSAGEASLFSMKGILREILKLLAPHFSEADSFWRGRKRRRKRGVGSG